MTDSHSPVRFLPINISALLSSVAQGMQTWKYVVTVSLSVSHKIHSYSVLHTYSPLRAMFNVVQPPLPISYTLLPIGKEYNLLSSYSLPTSPTQN